MQNKNSLILTKIDDIDQDTGYLNVDENEFYYVLVKSIE